MKRGDALALVLAIALIAIALLYFSAVSRSVGNISNPQNAHSVAQTSAPAHVVTWECYGNGFEIQECTVCTPNADGTANVHNCWIVATTFTATGSGAP